MISKKQYDLIVLDLLLDGEIGTHIIDHARRVWPNKTPGICIISAMTGADKIAHANGVNHFLAKPFNLDTFEELVLNKKCL